MASKFAEFLEKNKIDARRVLVASRQVERLRREDRALKLKKKQGGDAAPAVAPGGEEGEAPKAPPKPRSGRPVTPKLLEMAKEGGTIAGPAKTRLTRAVNRILEQKKKDVVAVRDLF
jgi:hypothetical protein